VTELALIVALEAGALALALVIVRVHAGAVDGPGARRVVAAIERASEALLARERTRQAPIAVLFALFAFGAESMLGRPDVGMARAAGVMVGALLGALIAAVAARLAGRAAAATLDAARGRFDLALSTALRLGGASGLGAQAAGALGAFALLLGDHLLRGSGSLSGPFSLNASSLPGYAAGAALAAVTTGRAASAYRVTAAAGASQALLHTPSIGASDPRNPALVSSLVAIDLASAARAVSAFAGSALLTALSLVIPRGLGLEGAHAMRFSVLSLVLPAFGIVASTVGLFVARTEENHEPHFALLRGLASSVWLLLLGVAGASYWLFPDAWWFFTGAGAAGLSLVIAGSSSVYASALGRARPESRPLVRAGAGTVGAWALLGGFRHASLLIVLAVAGALGAQALGVASGVPFGDRLGLLVALSALCALCPYMVGVEALASAAEGARGIGAMAVGDPEAARRAKRLDDTTEHSAAAARSYLTAATGLLSAGLALAVPVATAIVARPTLLLAGLALAGAAVCLFYASTGARRAARGAADANAEVARALEGQTGGLEPRAPSYRGCEEVCARAGLSEGPWDAAAACLPMVLLGIALELVYRSGSPRLAAEVFAVVTAGAAAAALWVALTANGARAVLFAVRRASRPDGDTASVAASASAGSLADILGNAASPAACMFSLMATSIGLSTPFFS